jgi:hypothetical protein
VIVDICHSTISTMHHVVPVASAAADFGFGLVLTNALTFIAMR